MPGFEQTKFLGASVIKFTSSVGWNEQASSATVSLVEDFTKGDRFTPGIVGGPARFAMGGFAFEGLLERHVQTRDVQGCPAYEVRLTDPREVLAGTQVIMAAYNGSTNAVPNLLNAYGYWEAELGFGGSMVNDSGMIWEAPFEILGLATGNTGGIDITAKAAGPIGVKAAIQAMTKAGNSFGGPLQFRGSTYAVDLSGLPPAPPYYRLNALGMSIIDIANQLCQDAGADYVVYLEGGTIKFRCVFRTDQPAIGTIANWVNSRTDATSKNAGVELRNEVTNAILLGGDVCQVAQVRNPAADETIWPYWGTDSQGKIVAGQGVPEQVNQTFKADATPIADVIGQLDYHCSVQELRCALMDYESWAFYVMKRHPKKAKAIGISNTVDADSDLATLFPDGIFRRDMIAQDEDSVTNLGEMNESDYWVTRANRVYDFVRGFAEMYGRQFLVRIPFFVYWKAEPETTTIISSDEICQDGGYVSEGGYPLGLPYESIDNFLTDDGRFSCFVAFPFDKMMDLRALDPNDYVLTNNTLYLRASVGSDIVYMPDSIYPYCVVTLAQPIFARATDPLGGVADIADIMGITDGPQVDANMLLQGGAGLRLGSWPVRINPAAFRPTSAAIPMRSNRMSYGPWWTGGGAAGKVDIQRDESLTPWEYGDVKTMNLAAQAKIAGIATEQQEAETGTVTQAGLPTIGLVDVLAAGGPEVTEIACSVGGDGVTTTYSMQTFVPTFGAFSKSNSERLKRAGTASQQIRRQIRNLFKARGQRAQVVAAAQAGFMQNAAYAVQQATPHDVILGCMVPAGDIAANVPGPGGYGYRTQVATMTVDELIANMRGDDQDTYKRMAGMGLEGLYRPFSASYKGEQPPAEGSTVGNQARGTTGFPLPDLNLAQQAALKAGNYPPVDDGVPISLPRFEKSRPDLYQKAYTTQELDPFRYSDVDVVVNGVAYGGASHRLKGRVDYTQARGIGLRGPVTVVGYGPELTGKPLPNSGDETKSVDQWADTFLDSPQLHPEKWRAGVLGVHYDTWRGVWTVPTILEGTLDADLTDTAGLASVLMSIVVFGSKVDSDGKPYGKVKVICNLGGPLIKQGSRVVASYYALENVWRITAASCNGS